MTLVVDHTSISSHCLNTGHYTVYAFGCFDQLQVTTVLCFNDLDMITVMCLCLLRVRDVMRFVDLDIITVMCFAFRFTCHHSA